MAYSKKFSTRPTTMNKLVTLQCVQCGALSHAVFGPGTEDKVLVCRQCRTTAFPIVRLTR